MKVVMKEGWITLDIIYSNGRKGWNFHTEDQGYVEEYYDNLKSQFLPGVKKRIFYCEADDAVVEK